ncbi:MAG TPA: hypothetical protein VKB05_09245 [Pyrinomonadaceae bacterium]|nr:hypothetical protein [Pyrinomonadaceae bacterium]
MVGGFDRDVLQKFYTLSADQLAQLFNIYSDEYGDGAAAYARKVYDEWKTGAVRPSAQTINRLLDHLPKVLSFDGKCELLRKLRERHRKPEHHSIKVKVDDWKSKLVPLVKRIVEKAYTSNLPEIVERRLTWLSSGDMQVARALLSHSQAMEGAVAVRLLEHEMQDLEAVVTHVHGSTKITHTISLPYGNIELKISGRRMMAKDGNNETDLVRQNNSGLFKPTAADIFDDVFSNLAEDQARQVKAKAAQEAMRLVAEKKRGEIKYENAAKDIANFVANADLMDQRKTDYQMSGQFESASGLTKIQVGRNWSRTIVIAVVIGLVLLAVAIYLLKM